MGFRCNIKFQVLPFHQPLLPIVLEATAAASHFLTSTKPHHLSRRTASLRDLHTILRYCWTSSQPATLLSPKLYSQDGRRCKYFLTQALKACSCEELQSSS